MDYIVKNHKDIFKANDLIIVPDWGVENLGLTHLVDALLEAGDLLAEGLQHGFERGLAGGGEGTGIDGLSHS